MVVHDVLLGVLIVVNVIGGFLLKRWIDSLRGTVEAQKTALDSVQRVADTAMTVFKATDPDRWAKEVAIHKELADKKAAAVVEEERRKADERIKAVDERARTFVNELATLRGEALGAAIRLIGQIPKESREQIIRDMRLRPVNEEPLLQAAAELPEPVQVNPAVAAFTRNLMDALTIHRHEPSPSAALEPHPERGGMDVH